MVLAFGIVPKKSLLKPGSQRFSPLFSSKKYIVFSFTVRFYFRFRFYFTVRF